MDFTSAACSGEKNANDVINETKEGTKHEMELRDPPNQDGDAPKSTEDYDMKKANGKAMEQSVGMKNESNTGDVNMEAAITTDDVIRAGGFGARDDISSFLPVAIDSTDFEASLRDARDFEEPQEEISRPGLGWTESMDGK
ncbi:uncharacterized protein [Elaeis guineensis]|uniref:Uncharacterized protein LOC105045582 isoform X1 n=2 Tax=Elaeis guineensis var. tenera TaxID=51953 RepID=A0A6I9R7U7_ELAGV|nr:uncharacterized protein LOC105045582 isoform X1 [Elaeis guineensis]XP_010922231.1 uncharacterized protein LOC105045582 isoform X1 [Elaeis guineensis]XP_010922232.1 uncharacterized protein LOC105045582 isoform X1 [Elaeis guineensis]